MTIIKKSTNNKSQWWCGEKEPSYILVQLLWRTVWSFLKKLKIELPYDLTIPLWGKRIYLEIYLEIKDICTSVFIAALFIIAKTWKQPKYPLTEEWIKKMWYIYTKEYYTAIKKNEIIPLAAIWMDSETVILSEVSQRSRSITWHPLYAESKKTWYK